MSDERVNIYLHRDTLNLSIHIIDTYSAILLMASKNKCQIDYKHWLKDFVFEQLPYTDLTVRHFIENHEISLEQMARDLYMPHS